jgi:hypothetical protein
MDAYPQYFSKEKELAQKVLVANNDVDKIKALGSRRSFTTYSGLIIKEIAFCKSS